MNRTLIERAKCMLLNAQLQNSYWGEAVVTAAHIINRSPTRSLSDITPEEMWTGKQPDLSHMKIFGCKAMVHIPKECRKKLDAKSRELIFVGYSNCVKGYRFIDPMSKQAITSRDVVFLESSVKRNIISNEQHESPVENNTVENKNENLLNEKVNKQITYSPSKMIYVPLFDADTEEEICQSDDKNDYSASSSQQNSSQSSNYTNPDDETYIPDESISSPIYVNVRTRRNRVNKEDLPSPTSYMCMNGESAMSILDSDPQCLAEALEGSKAELWKEAMNEEYQSLLNNNTWTLVTLPKNKRAIPCKWVFKTKTDEHGNILRYKARLVVKGYCQKKGIDYHEIYAPVVRYSSLRYVIGLAAKYKLKIFQMDAVTAFLQGDIEEEIFMSQPPCFVEGDKVCLLKKSIYGLKQASRQWNKKLNTALLEIGMSRSKVDPCIYYRIIDKEDMLFITVYVDDLLYIFNKEDTASMLKKKLSEKFHMKDLGIAKQCIGFRISQNSRQNEISLDQSLYIEKILNRFNMSDCKPIHSPCDANVQLKIADSNDKILRDVPYQEVIGCLLYLSQGTRPDITFAVNMLSRYNNNPTTQHWTAVKRVLRYLKGTVNTKLIFKKNDKNIVGYCDADWATDIEDRRSCSGYIFLFQGAAISWCSKRQPTVALSSTEAEYMSLATAIQEAMWLRQLETECWPHLSDTPISIYCDNQSAISLSGSDMFHARSKHIDVRYHFIREKIANNEVAIVYKSTQAMVADALTKGLHRPKHQAFTEAMGLRSGEDVG